MGFTQDYTLTCVTSVNCRSAHTVATSAYPSIPNLSVMRVADFIMSSPAGLTWNGDLLRTLWPTPIVLEILKIPLGSRDLACGQDEPAGSCSFKSLYKHLYPRPMGPALPWRTVWKLDIPHKLQIFCWRLLLDRLPTRARLSNWNAEINPGCPVCRMSNETVDHLFDHCSFSRLVWDLLPSSFPPPPASSSISVCTIIRATVPGRLSYNLTSTIQTAPEPFHGISKEVCS
ncbi:hypothetical protein MRB53_001590 [Persea americana]|uniref:Uncharacterized protein n=1 Tax=Persea americana TaxID=3435 RepID=A0ACC2MS14_PERAE|nr:hypothetical protein MRB53_001590 [Persea americana]